VNAYSTVSRIIIKDRKIVRLNDTRYQWHFKKNYLFNWIQSSSVTWLLPFSLSCMGGVSWPVSECERKEMVSTRRSGTETEESDGSRELERTFVLHLPHLTDKNAMCLFCGWISTVIMSSQNFSFLPDMNFESQFWFGCFKTRQNQTVSNW
jgi:hypothetical protein